MSNDNQIIFDRILPIIEGFHPYLFELALDKTIVENVFIATVVEQMPSTNERRQWQYHVIYSQEQKNPMLKAELIAGAFFYRLYV